ncbi:hypothetical protein EVAR_90839_1 [Eumeta japonica]|uniref:SAM domain-containing protein n=1 Tax=Eumeta variegata TaxID=151549 RepID=A0A4C1ZNF9_EUMVA|nr:hypothetical protein EVAR_90839_1 [Eumeta japonica]
MDQYTSDLLIKWGLLEYVSVFAAARIDSMTLEMLEPNDVAQLINPIGDQLRFKANLEVWKKEMVVAGQNRNVTADVNETPLDSSFMGRLLRDLDNPSENCSPSTSIQRDSSLAPESDNIENEESPVHFYAPYLRATEFQTKRNTSGILYNAYSTRKRHLRSLGALPASKRSTSRRQSTNSDTKRTIPSGIIFEEHSTVEVAELLKNLEHPDPGPWQTIEQTWTSTLHGYIFVPRKANKEESELNVSLLLLPFIINISPVRRKDSWKASRSEVRDGFITHVPTDREILVALAERRENLPRTGIREECCWFALKEFDLFENVAVDLMHDLLKELPDIL